MSTCFGGGGKLTGAGGGGGSTGLKTGGGGRLITGAGGVGTVFGTLGGGGLKGGGGGRLTGLNAGGGGRLTGLKAGGGGKTFMGGGGRSSNGGSGGSGGNESSEGGGGGGGGRFKVPGSPGRGGGGGGGGSPPGDPPMLTFMTFALLPFPNCFSSMALAFLNPSWSPLISSFLTSTVDCGSFFLPNSSSSIFLFWLKFSPCPLTSGLACLGFSGSGSSPPPIFCLRRLMASSSSWFIISNISSKLHPAFPNYPFHRIMRRKATLAIFMVRDRWIKSARSSRRPLEDDPEIQNLEFPIVLLLVSVLSDHPDNLGLELLLDPLHDHAHPADLALPRQQLHLVVGGELLPHESHRLVDADVLHALEFGLLEHGSQLFAQRHRLSNQIKQYPGELFKIHDQYTSIMLQDSLLTNQLAFFRSDKHETQPFSMKT